MMLYKVIDNFAGIIRETDNHEAFKEIIDDLKRDYTTYEYIDENTIVEKPNYIITTNEYFENDKLYCRVYFDIRK